MIENADGCRFCGHDPALYATRSDVESTLVIIPLMLDAAAEGMSIADLDRRIGPTRWSIAEYVHHVREVYAVHAGALADAFADPEAAIAWPDVTPLAPTQHGVDFHAALSALTSDAEQLRKFVKQASDRDWDRGFRHHALNVVHEGMHHLADVGRIRHELGHGATAGHGVVTQISASTGGVPKEAVDAATVSPAGVVGDSQNDRKHHGRPFQALCLWSHGVIDRLRAEGHPIGPGCAGENLTVEGVDWASLRPGSRIQVGEVSMLIAAHAIPCAKNAQWFSDRNVKRISHKHHPGDSRLYAVPLGSGTIAPGDSVVIEPDVDH